MSKGSIIRFTHCCEYQSISFSIQEHPSFNFDGADNSMVNTPLTDKDGYLYIPDAPGIGIELVDDVKELFPPKQRDLSVKIAMDGSVADR
ncbi:hypothetical protein ACFLZT_01125 [Thermodesulfobacteriota bacterium]